MIVTSNGSKGHHKFTLEVVEKVTDDSIATNTTYIDYTFKISPIQNNWDWRNWGSKISYRIELGDNVYTGTIPAYDGVSTVTLKYANNIPIVHDSDGTKTISLYFKVTDGANQNYTCGNAEASSTMTLTALHKPPVINVSSVSERNSALTGISVPNNTVVQYLSTKRFTMATPTLYDDATIVSYTVYHNGIQLGTSSTNKIDANFNLAGELITTIINNVEYVPIQIVAVDSLNGITTITKNYAIIKYTRPMIQKASTNIKRKAPLTDSEGLLNFIGTIYKGNDVVGNANSQQVQYKIWTVTEPSYTNINSSQSSGNVTITDFVVSGLSYLTAWNYKIKIKDTFTNSDTTVYVKEDRIPTGTAVWTEYKDRVDFLKLTVGDEEVVPNKHIGNYAKIRLNTRYTLSQTAWSKPQIDFTNNDFDSNDNDDFEEDTHGIVCKFSGTILVSKSLCTDSPYEIDIMDDSNSFPEMININGGTTYINYPMEVVANQLIDLRINTGDTSLIVYEGTQISITRIK